MIGTGLLLAAALTVEAGGVAALRLPWDATSARYQDDDVLVIDGHAIIGVGADAAAGKHAVAVRTAAGEERSLSFVVAPREFPEERLTVARRHVNPSPEQRKRYAREAAIQRDAYALRTEVRDGLAPFAEPLAGRISSEFGFRRIFNGQPRSRHSGVDIAANTGTPVKNPAPGTVAAVGDYFFNGKTVLVDHGGGLVAMYCHLSRIDVAKGDELQRGDILGAVGATGRVTGPHLHWTVSIRGVRVDPLRFQETLNRL